MNILTAAQDRFLAYAEKTADSSDTLNTMLDLLLLHMQNFIFFITVFGCWLDGREWSMIETVAAFVLVNLWRIIAKRLMLWRIKQ